MHNACSFAGADLFPWDDGMHDTLFRGEFIKGATITPSQHVASIERLHHTVVALVSSLERSQYRQQRFRQVVELSILLDLDVSQVGMYGCCNVRRQRPGRSGPDQ